MGKLIAVWVGTRRAEHTLGHCGPSFTEFSNYGRDWKEAPRNARSRKVSERASESVLKTREGRREEVASVLGVRPAVHRPCPPAPDPSSFRAFLRPRGYLFVRNYAPTAPPSQSPPPPSAATPQFFIVVRPSSNCNEQGSGPNGVQFQPAIPFIPSGPF